MSMKFGLTETCVTQPPTNVFGQDVDTVRMEVEKIRRWKVFVDMNLKKKNSAIQHLSQTVHSQRKSLVDVQMDYENTSAQLQREINKRKTCFEKINHTKSMCQILKQQTGKMQLNVDFFLEFRREILKEQSCEKHNIKVLLEKIDLICDSFNKDKVLYMHEANLFQYLRGYENLQKLKVTADFNNLVRLYRNDLRDKKTFFQRLALQIQNHKKQLEKITSCYFSWCQSSKRAKQNLKLNNQLLHSNYRDLKILAASIHSNFKVINESQQVKIEKNQVFYQSLVDHMLEEKVLQFKCTENYQKIRGVSIQAHISEIDTKEKIKVQTIIFQEIINWLVQRAGRQRHQALTLLTEFVPFWRFKLQNIHDRLNNERRSRLGLAKHCKDLTTQNTNCLQIIQKHEQFRKTTMQHARSIVLKGNNNLLTWRLESLAGVLFNAYLHRKNSQYQLQVVLNQQLSLDFCESMKSKLSHLKKVWKTMKHFEKKLDATQKLMENQNDTLNVYSSYCAQMASIKSEQEKDLIKLRKELSSIKARVKSPAYKRSSRNTPSKKNSTPYLMPIHTSLQQTLPKHSTPKQVTYSPALQWNNDKVKGLRGPKRKKRKSNVPTSFNQTDNWFENDKVFGFFE